MNRDYATETETSHKTPAISGKTTGYDGYAKYDVASWPPADDLP